jgi:hypothetical protein
MVISIGMILVVLALLFAVLSAAQQRFSTYLWVSVVLLCVAMLVGVMR